MSVERTRQVMNRYWDSDHKDVSMMTDDVVFTHMASGDEHRGPDAVRRMLDYMYRQAFNATAEIHTRICSEDHAIIEADFVGTHTGEFAGIPATGRQVRVPFCVIYELVGDRITRGRVYMEMPVMMRQLDKMPTPAATA